MENSSEQESALQPEPCPVPWALQDLPASLPAVWNNVCDTLLSCPPQGWRNGDMHTKWLTTVWTDGRAGGSENRSIPLPKRDCSDTAAAHTAPLPSTKTRKWLLQVEKKGGENSYAPAPRRRKDLWKLDCCHLNPIVHNDYNCPISWACSFLQQQSGCQNLTKPQSRMNSQDEHYITTQWHELEAGRDVRAPFSCPCAPELPCCLGLAAWAHIHGST